MMYRTILTASVIMLVMSTLSRPALAQSTRDAANGGEAFSVAVTVPLKAKFVSASSRDAYQNPDAVLDGDPATEFTFVWGNGGAEIVLDLGGPSVVESLEITSGPTGGPFYLSEVNVGPTPDTLADVDNSRAMIAPGNCEDGANPLRTVGIELWVQGRTRPAPLSRAKVEQLGGTRTSLTVQAYEGPLAPPPPTVDQPDPASPAIPPAASESKDSLRLRPADAQKPDDP